MAGLFAGRTHPFSYSYPGQYVAHQSWWGTGETELAIARQDAVGGIPPPQNVVCVQRAGLCIGHEDSRWGVPYCSFLQQPAGGFAAL